MLSSGPDTSHQSKPDRSVGDTHSPRSNFLRANARENSQKISSNKDLNMKSISDDEEEEEESNESASDVPQKDNARALNQEQATSGAKNNLNLIWNQASQRSIKLVKADSSFTENGFGGGNAPNMLGINLNAVTAALGGNAARQMSN